MLLSNALRPSPSGRRTIVSHSRFIPPASPPARPWQTAGGDLGPALDSTHLGSGRVGAWLRFDVTAHVQQVVAGVSPNYGFALTSADDTWDPTEAINGVRYGLASSEHWDASKAGYLRVMFRTFTE